MQPKSTHVALQDLDLAAFMLSCGLQLLRVEAGAPRACFILHDPRGVAASLQKAFVGERSLREYLRIRRRLRIGLERARLREDRTLTASDLAVICEETLAVSTARRRAKVATG
jgi:hypothetical protein